MVDTLDWVVKRICAPHQLGYLKEERLFIICKLIDRFGRTVKKLRVSVTNRCNMRCSYCMPAEGLRWTPNGPGT